MEPQQSVARIIAYGEPWRADRLQQRTNPAYAQNRQTEEGAGQVVAGPNRTPHQSHYLGLLSHETQEPKTAPRTKKCEAVQGEGILMGDHIAPHELMRTTNRLLMESKMKMAAKKGITFASKALYCKDCLHHSAEFLQDKQKVLHTCNCDALRNLVTGHPSDPLSNRKNETLCGKNAIHWQPKK